MRSEKVEEIMASHPHVAFDIAPVHLNDEIADCLNL
jgi:hypothetical protein